MPASDLPEVNIDARRLVGLVSHSLTAGLLINWNVWPRVVSDERSHSQASSRAGLPNIARNFSAPAFFRSLRRTGLPPAHAAVFDLKAGGVSAVISDNGGHYVYKVASKEVLPLDQVKDEIHNKLKSERLKAMMDTYTNSFTAVPNEEYFGPAAAAGPPMPRGRMPMPPGQQGQPQGQPPAANPPAQPPPAPTAPPTKPN